MAKKLLLIYALKIGVTWALVSSFGKCNIDDVVERSSNILRDNNPAVYNTIDKVIESGEKLYDIVKDIGIMDYVYSTRHSYD